jgi:hypothetical protein
LTLKGPILITRSEKGPFMAKQALILHIDEDLAREVRELLAASGQGYASLSEFVEVALINQLGAEESAADGGPKAVTNASPTKFSSTRRLLAAPDLEPGRLAADPNPSAEGLFVLTNRFGPMKIAARVLANMWARGDWPELGEFQATAAGAARELGLRLRAEDEAERRTVQARRWVAFPVGADERAAADRFAFSFTLAGSNDSAVGPMALLGLANLVGGRPALTAEGWSLAAALSPLLGEIQGSRLSENEAKILRGAVLRAPGELAAVQEFVRLVARSGGFQSRLDELIAAQHADWTNDLAVAHRSAMLGRLSDLSVLEVTGRGPKATIQLLSPTEEFNTSEEAHA